MTFLLVLLVSGLGAWLFIGRREARDTVVGLERRVVFLERRMSEVMERIGPAPKPQTAAELAAEPVRDAAAAVASPPGAPFTDPLPATSPSAAVPPPLPPLQRMPPLVSVSGPSVPFAPPKMVPPALTPAPDAAGRSAEPATAEGAPGLERELQSEAASGVAPAASILAAAREPELQPAIQLESFLGVKLFAWLGGLALFLGVAFFIKYSFDHDLISPQMRVGIGYGVGLALLLAGRFISRVRHAVTVQSLSATGIVVLYADTFAAQAHYGFLGLVPAFGIMTAITVLAFVLAVRLQAQMVAILGWLGGFLTPWLLSTGQDNPLGLFGYLALLDAGLLAVAIRQRWHYLAVLGAGATLVMQLGWVERFFVEAKFGTAQAIFGGFALLFLAAYRWAQRKGQAERWLAAATMIPPVAGWIFVVELLWHPYPALAGRTAPILGMVLALDLVFLALAWWRAQLRPALLASGGVVFLLLMGWTIQYLTPERLNVALVFYLAFAAVHAAIPFWLELRRPSPEAGTALARGLQAFPALGLLLVVVPLFTLGAPTWWVWPVVLAINGLAIVLAVVGASLGSLLGVVLLTALGAAAWVMRQAIDSPQIPGLLAIVAGFSLVFVGAGWWATRRLADGSGLAGGRIGGMTKAQVGAAASLSAALPFLLLTMSVLRFSVANPSAIFGVAAALALVLVVAAARAGIGGMMPMVVLGSGLLLEYAWHWRSFQAEQLSLGLGWTLGWGGMFFVLPFVFWRRLAWPAGAWWMSALAWPTHFLLFHRMLAVALPGWAYPGLTPVLLALPCLGAVIWLRRSERVDESGALLRRALFGGVTLFFVTLAVPIQFDRHWVTLAWALEGAALLALFHRVPHPGLRGLGVGLLSVSFVRLAMNPWVITDYERTGTPILNWYLYTYGLVVVALMVGARLLAPPRERMAKLNLPPLLYSMGTVLLFLLVNIEIADYFSPRGSRLVFNFSAGFAQDMTYTLAWALFGSGLMAVGFRWRVAGTRYAGLGLMGVTLMKLFLHDLWRLGGLYRIGALVGLAVVLMLISFVYQRFLGTSRNASGGSES